MWPIGRNRRTEQKVAELTENEINLSRTNRLSATASRLRFLYFLLYEPRNTKAANLLPVHLRPTRHKSFFLNITSNVS